MIIYKSCSILNFLKHIIDVRLTVGINLLDDALELLLRDIVPQHGQDSSHHGGLDVPLTGGEGIERPLQDCNTM